MDRFQTYEEMLEAEEPTREFVEKVLRGSWTPRGVNLWWDRPRYQLDGKTPNEVWEAGDRQAVVDLAIEGTEQTAT